jgi:hypothetical protein
MRSVDDAARDPRVQRTTFLEPSACLYRTGESLLNRILRKLRTTRTGEGEAEEVAATVAVKGFDSSQR